MKDEDQGELFSPDGEAYARGSDPDTSHDAAESVRGKIATQLEFKVLVALRTFGGTREYPDGLINHEIVELTELTWNTATPRLAPLCRKGLAYDTGKRRKGPTKRPCIVWAASPSGAGTCSQLVPKPILALSQKSC